MIVDSHAHLFPYMGGASGFPSVEHHLRRIQKSASTSSNPARRKRDNSTVHERTLWDGKDRSPTGLAQVGFRATRFGRFEWTTEKDQLYLQYFAPSLADHICSADYLVAEMDWAGVDVAILQNCPLYGHLGDFFADSLRQYPGRFVGSAHVLETEAHTDEQLHELHRSAEILGHKAVYYEVAGFWEDGFRDNPDDPKFDIFWAEVRRLGLVLYYYPSAIGSPPYEAYAEQLLRLYRILERHPGIPTVLVQAFPLANCARSGRYDLPQVALELGKMPDFLVEITYPISYGGEWEFPYQESWSFIRQLYDWFGPERLVWGSDMPNVLRFCTYRQSYQYLWRSGAMPPGDLDLLLGGNLARLFGLGLMGTDANPVGRIEP